MKTWNIGNTTVRNPARIKDGLRVLQKYFEGKAWNEKNHQKYYDYLVTEKVLEPAAGKIPKANSKGITGRKWAAVSNQLGFCRAWSGEPVTISPVGHILIKSEIEQIDQEIFLRQLLKYQQPSPIEGGKDYVGFNIAPFKFLLNVIFELEKRGLTGVTKEEIALFVVTEVTNEGINQAVDNILKYRKLRNSKPGRVNKKKLFGEIRNKIVQSLYKTDLEKDYETIGQIYSTYKRNKDISLLKKQLSELAAGGKGKNTAKAQGFTNKAIEMLKGDGQKVDLVNLFNEMRLTVKGGTLGDYADSAARYSSLTGLFSISGDKLVLVSEKNTLIKKIVSEGLGIVSNDKYLDQLYSPELPVLPTDQETFLSKYLIELKEKRDRLSASTKIEPLTKAKVPGGKRVIDLKRYSFELEKEITEYKEYEFYKKQSEKESISDIFEYFEGIEDGSLFGGNAYRPAFIEWTVWRVFLAINRIEGRVSDTRNFRVDSEISPIHHAKGGVADLVFSYQDFVIGCEVTLNTNANQWSAEGEPVPRHIWDIVAKNSKPVFGVFVAPSIHPQTAQQFLTQVWLTETNKIPLNIVPLTIEQIKILLKTFDDHRFDTNEMKSLLVSFFELKSGCDDGNEWLKRIKVCFDAWVDSFIKKTA